MPRKATGKNELGRMRQQRYRARLAVRREPEVADLDTALAVSIAGLVNELEAWTKNKASAAEATDTDKPKAPALSKAMLERVVLAAVDHLRSTGYNGERAGKLMYRRLTWLREGLKDPNANWLQRRGFHL